LIHILIEQKITKKNWFTSTEPTCETYRRAHSYLRQRELVKGQGPESEFKLIYGATPSNMDWNWLNFDECEYTNCVVKKYEENRIYKDADIVIMEQAFTLSYVQLQSLELAMLNRSDQLWIFFTHEAAIYTPPEYGRTPNILIDGWFNATMTFRRDSDVYYPYGAKRATGRINRTLIRKSFLEKTQGAYVYVSNCATGHYQRLATITKLKEHIPVDVFGKCTGKTPCKERFSVNCEAEIHKGYRFYLSFENSLCKDYITEKFWLRMATDGYFVPVVVGGLSMNDYSRVAPPNSFIHIDNFTSILELGQYLKTLMADDEAYSRYHEWRADFSIVNWTNPTSLGVACKLCELANKKPRMPVKNDIFQWMNYYDTRGKSYCRSVNYQ
jgi:hypothetical protein